MQHDAILEGFRAGRRAALSRAISLAERDAPGFAELFDALYDPARSGRRIGVTGPPGAGKSTLVSGLVHEIRRAGHEVGVVAVDPSSPFTGGAVLGDRVRMHEHIGDPGVFIRSMATRGSLGGLARASLEASDLLASFGFPYVLLETVGVGQSEFDVLEASDLVLVVLHPGAGDSIQAMKAGLLELADVFVLNKCDQSGALRLETDLEEMLELRGTGRRRDVPILRTEAHVGRGLDGLWACIEDCFGRFERSGELARRRHDRRAGQVQRIAEEVLRDELRRRIAGSGVAAEAPDAAVGPYRRAREVLDALLPPERPA